MWLLLLKEFLTTDYTIEWLFKSVYDESLDCIIMLSVRNLGTFLAALLVEMNPSVPL